MTGIPGPLDFLSAVTGMVDSGRTSSADRPIRLAVVDPDYNPMEGYPAATPPARVTFEGEETLTTKAYPLALGFVPRPGQRVYLTPIGNGYLIAGGINAQTPQGFWQDADGAEFGVELGGGSYFDSTEGLFLETDATVAGDLQGARFYHAARALRVPEVQFGIASVSFTSVTSHSHAVTFSTPWPVGTTVVVPRPNIASPAGQTQYYDIRAHTVSHTGFTMLIAISDAARVAQTWSAVPVHWVAFALPST